MLNFPVLFFFKWIELTNGTDVTEVFEASHLNMKLTRSILDKYYICDADCPRVGPVATFDANGCVQKLYSFGIFDVIGLLLNLGNYT